MSDERLQGGQCRKCLSFGYCYFQKDCGRDQRWVGKQ